MPAAHANRRPRRFPPCMDVSATSGFPACLWGRRPGGPNLPGARASHSATKPRAHRHRREALHAETLAPGARAARVGITLTAAGVAVGSSFGVFFDAEWSRAWRHRGRRPPGSGSISRQWPRAHPASGRGFGDATATAAHIADLSWAMTGCSNRQTLKHRLRRSGIFGTGSDVCGRDLALARAGAPPPPTARMPVRDRSRITA